MAGFMQFTYDHSCGGVCGVDVDRQRTHAIAAVGGRRSGGLERERLRSKPQTKTIQFPFS